MLEFKQAKPFNLIVEDNSISIDSKQYLLTSQLLTTHSTITIQSKQISKKAIQSIHGLSRSKKQKSSPTTQKFSRKDAMKNSESEQPKTDDWAPVLKKIAEKRDRQAFAQLFAHFGPKVKTYGLMLNSAHTSQEMAEELVQNVMLKVWLKAAHFDSNKASASTWIFTIARNCRIDFLRKVKRTDTALTADDLWPIPEEESPYTSLHQRRIEKVIRSAVDKLPIEQASVLRHIYMEGKSHSEIAELTGLPLGTVKSRVRLAIGKLRTLIS